MLCNICNDLNFDELLLTADAMDSGIISGTKQHTSYTSLERAAEAGCDLCEAILRLSCDLVTPLHRMQNWPIRMKIRLQGLDSSYYEGAFKLLVHYGGLLIGQFEVYVPRESYLAKSQMKLISGRPICLDPASRECISIAKEWIRQCVNSECHSMCQTVSKGTDVSMPAGRSISLPTRLIDVGFSGNTGACRLILSAGIPEWESSSYAALSHRWKAPDLRRIEAVGSSPSILQAQTESITATARTTGPLTTVLANYRERLQSILIQDLPRTFQDAVLVTGSLGLRYIWIDSLCIIQDSKPDWEYESARMADIYKNSYVAIAAESSRDSNDGMLKSRRLDFYPIEIPLNSKVHNIQTSIYLRPVQDDWETCITKKLYKGSGSTLSSRAWVLQETLLAPRTIHYGRQQMFWQCRTSSYAEGNLTPILPRKRASKWSWSRSKCFLYDLQNVSEIVRTDVDDMISLKDTLYLRWYATVEDYSLRDITFPSDIFPALIGLATEFNLHLHDRYLAGLWKADLLRGLLWSVEEPEPCVIAAPYRAPSWSWASIVGQIRSPQGLGCIHSIGKYSAEIIDTNVVASSSITDLSMGNVYGEISRGILRLRGRWISTNQWPTFQDTPWKRGFISTAFDGEGVLFRYLDLGKEEFVEERIKKGKNLGLLQIGYFAEKLGHQADGHVYCLILESGDGGNTGYYRRVGVVQTFMCPDEWLESWEIREVTII